MAKQPWDALNELLPGDALARARALEALQLYTRTLLEWNRGISNLISRNDEQRFVERHLRESLAPLKQLMESGHERWLDFGSGGGLPALPLALAGLGAHWTLVEARRNKTLFLKRVLQDSRIRNIEVVTARLESALKEGDAEQLNCEAFTSRATMVIAPTLAMAAVIVQPGGHAYLWKGSRWEQEVRDDAAWKHAWRFEQAIPIEDGPNVVATFVRI